jgi:hypothetical protein
VRGGPAPRSEIPTDGPTHRLFNAQSVDNEARQRFIASCIAPQMMDARRTFICCRVKPIRDRHGDMLNETISFAVCEIRARITWSAKNDDDATTIATSIVEYIDSFAQRGLRGARFIRSVTPTATADKREGLGNASGEGAQGALSTAELILEVIGRDERLAKERFDHFRNFVLELCRLADDDGLVKREFVIEAANFIGEPRGEEFDRFLASIFYPASRAWTDHADDGSWSQRDIDELALRRVDDSLYLRTNEHIEAVCAIEKCGESLARVEIDIYQWKWAILAMHIALQTTMVLALQGTWPIMVLKKEIREPVLRAHAGVGEFSAPDRTGQPAAYELDYFLELYDRVKKQAFMGQYMHSQAFRPGPRHTPSV